MRPNKKEIKNTLENAIHKGLDYIQNITLSFGQGYEEILEWCDKFLKEPLSGIHYFIDTKDNKKVYNKDELIEKLSKYITYPSQIIMSISHIDNEKRDLFFDFTIYTDDIHLQFKDDELNERYSEILEYSEIGSYGSLFSKSKGTVQINNANTVKAYDGSYITLDNRSQIMVKDEKGKVTLNFNLTCGSKLFVNHGDKVNADQILAEWDPYTSPIINEVSGTVKFVDLIEGKTLQRSECEVTGFVNDYVLDFKSQSSKGKLKPRVVIINDAGEEVSNHLRDDKGNSIKLPNGKLATRFLPPGATLIVENGQKISPGDVIARIPKEFEIEKTDDYKNFLNIRNQFLNNFPSHELKYLNIFCEVNMQKINEQIRK